MTLIKRANILPYIADVTPEQIDMCGRCIDESTMHPFYIVQSEDGGVDEDGYVQQYKVTYSQTFGFQCTCPSGLHGFWNVKHPSGVCKHVRWAVAASEDYKQLIKAEAEAAARIAAKTVKAPQPSAPAPVAKVEPEHYTDVDAQTLARIQRRDQERKEAKPKPTRKVAYAQTRPGGFSLMR